MQLVVAGCLSPALKEIPGTFNFVIFTFLPCNYNSLSLTPSLFVLHPTSQMRAVVLTHLKSCPKMSQEGVCLMEMWRFSREADFRSDAMSWLFLSLKFCRICPRSYWFCPKHYDDYDVSIFEQVEMLTLSVVYNLIGEAGELSLLRACNVLSYELTDVFLFPVPCALSHSWDKIHLKMLLSCQPWKYHLQKMFYN